MASDAVECSRAVPAMLPRPAISTMPLTAITASPHFAVPLQLTFEEPDCLECSPASRQGHL
jgi:hypothetical protein